MHRVALVLVGALFAGCATSVPVREPLDGAVPATPQAYGAAEKRCWSAGGYAALRYVDRTTNTMTVECLVR